MIRTFAMLALALTTSRSDPLAGRIAGKPVQCINLQQIQGPSVVDRHTIIYRQSGRRIWVTHPVGNCPALRPIVTLITQVYGGQLCRNDRFQVLEANAIIPSAYCRFDYFTPYDKPAKPKR